MKRLDLATFKKAMIIAILVFAGCTGLGERRGGSMEGDELKSKLKGALEAAGGVDEPSLKLSEADMAWWKDAKFGMFIHWGLYAIPARGEWAMFSEKIPAEQYAKLADEFNPRHYDPSAWVEAAKAAGMRYMVLTARHHDGFALWDSPGSWDGFDAVRHTAKRDLVRPFVDAVRKAGLRVGLYYSPMDWRFPGYFKPRELVENASLMKKQGYAQVEELATNYGRIDVLWYDGGWLAHTGSDADAAWFWEPVKLNTMVRSHQPKVVISPRSGWIGDFKTDEGGHDVTGPIRAEAWEKCLSLGPSWGYTANQNLLGRDRVLDLFVNILVRGGNMLLNVGPDRDGLIPPGQVRRLKEVGDWIRTRSEAIFGTRPGPLEPVAGLYGTTQKGRKVFLFVFHWPEEGPGLLLPMKAAELSGAKLIPNGKLAWKAAEGGILLNADPKDRDPVATIVELTLR